MLVQSDLKMLIRLCDWLNPYVNDRIFLRCSMMVVPQYHQLVFVVENVYGLCDQLLTVQKIQKNCVPAFLSSK